MDLADALIDIGLPADADERGSASRDSAATGRIADYGNYAAPGFDRLHRYYPVSRGKLLPAVGD